MASGYLDSYMSHLEADPIGVGNTLEAMPAEILQKTFVYSMNVYLPQVSRILRAVLDNEYVRLCFSESVFIEAYWIWHLLRRTESTMLVVPGTYFLLNPGSPTSSHRRWKQLSGDAYPSVSYRSITDLGAMAYSPHVLVNTRLRSQFVVSTPR